MYYKKSKANIHKKHKVILTTLVTLSLLQSQVYAQITTKPELGQTYDDYLSYTADTSNDRVKLNNNSGTINFNKGGELIAGEKCNGWEETILEIGNGRDVTINVGTANDKEYDLIFNGYAKALRVTGDNTKLTIDAGDTGRLYLTNQISLDNSFLTGENLHTAAFWVDDGSSVYVKGHSLKMDAISSTGILVLDANLDIDLNGDFNVENVETGMWVYGTGENSNLDLTADNIIVKTSKDVAEVTKDGGYGLRVNATNGKELSIDLDADKKIELVGQDYGAAIVGNGKSISNLTADTIVLNAEKSKGIGLYFGNTDAISSHKLTLEADSQLDISSDYIGVYLLGDKNSADPNKEKNTNFIVQNTGTVNITGNSYSGIYSSASNSNISANTVNIKSDYIGTYLTNNANLTVQNAGLVDIKGGTFGLYAKSSTSDITTDALKIAVDSNCAVWLAGKASSTFNVNGLTEINGGIFAKEESSFDLATDTAILNADITAENSTIGLTANKQANLTGYIISGEEGAVNLSVGENSIWNGFADDYQNLDNSYSKAHVELFGHGFANTPTTGGQVNVTLGNNAKWNVNRQSWVTKLNGSNGIVDLAENGADAIHISELSGSNTFVLELKPEELVKSDMLYIQNDSDETQNIIIKNADEVLNNMQVGEKIRFATVGNSQKSFEEAVIGDAGVYNVHFAVKYADYNDSVNNDKENDDLYNGGANFGDNEAKPGTDYVNDIYGNGSNAQNAYLQRKENIVENISDAGKTIINMSRANYKNAVYMDRLIKRLGEARYINGEENQGMWVRLRHDRIGQSGDFRSMNTMYELGYDVKQDCDNGERRVGFAVDYMRGSTTYSDIMGKGETKRYGLWLYDTWLGDKGHYADYVLKWGHLSNDFDITAKSTLKNITGDYSNNVFSVSAEYGKKNSMGNGWYFEPQAQLQLARVTGADYVSSQDTKVSVDGINSLIGRAGFRLGRDLNESSTVYLKADLLHEFLGDQTITATDATGTLREEFENKGTWYDVGIGFAAQTGKNSYAFLDVEKSFGNGNDETYQINAGLQWTF